LGILGGVFNPPHLGHLICAQEAHAQLDLEKVLLMPVGQATHREVDQDPGAELRAALCDLAVHGDPRLAVSRAEVERPGPSYSVDTLRELRQRTPGDELTMILGADQASRLPSWREPEAVLSLARMAVAEREGVERQSVLKGLDGLSGGERIAFFQMPRIDISSSLVRERAASGRPIRYLVPDKVADYVEARGLYGASAGVTAE
jgi:nicotinate-nucleotide adenylyltransferase